MMRKFLAPVLAVAALGVVVAVPLASQPPAAGQAGMSAERVDAAMNAKIRAEGLDRSQVMRIEHVLTDVYGPRVTGSPNHKAAGEWAVKEMTSWGMKNGRSSRGTGGTRAGSANGPTGTSSRRSSPT